MRINTRPGTDLLPISCVKVLSRRVEKLTALAFTCLTRFHLVLS